MSEQPSEEHPLRRALADALDERIRRLPWELDLFLRRACSSGVTALPSYVVPVLVEHGMLTESGGLTERATLYLCQHPEVVKPEAAVRAEREAAEAERERVQREAEESQAREALHRRLDAATSGETELDRRAARALIVSRQSVELLTGPPRFLDSDKIHLLLSGLVGLSRFVLEVEDGRELPSRWREFK